MRMTRKIAALLAVLALAAAACGGGDGPVDTTGTDAGDTASDDDADVAADDSDDDDDGDAGGDDGDDDTGADDGDDTAATDELSGTLNGAGASFPDPVFQDYIYEYTTEFQPGVTVDYQSIGSGGGIEQFLLEQVDFGSSERYLREDDLEEAAENRGCEAIQFPVLFGAVVIAFGDDQYDGLVLSPEVIADIFQRNITNYSDDAIAELNPDFDLPDQEIVPVHRSDGSGTTSVFTTYLDDAAANWELGEGTEVQWPSGTVGGQGNEGVTASTQQNDGGIGYVNQAYALINDLPTALVMNADGNAVAGSLEATTEALEVLEIPDDFQFDILGVGGEGYPIVGANWIFTYECGYDGDIAELLIDFWTWATQDQAAIDLALELGYAPLGEGLRPRVLEAIERTGSQD